MTKKLFHILMLLALSLAFAGCAQIERAAVRVQEGVDENRDLRNQIAADAARSRLDNVEQQDDFLQAFGRDIDEQRVESLSSALQRAGQLLTNLCALTGHDNGTLSTQDANSIVRFQCETTSAAIDTDPPE